MPEDMDNAGAESEVVAPEEAQDAPAEAAVAKTVEVTEKPVDSEQLAEQPAEKPVDLDDAAVAVPEQAAPIEASDEMEPTDAPAEVEHDEAPADETRLTETAPGTPDPETVTAPAVEIPSDSTLERESIEEVLPTAPTVEPATGAVPVEVGATADATPEPTPEPVAPIVFTYQTGDIVPGIITAIGANGIEVDLDGELAVIPKAELVDGTDPAVGESVEGMVIRHQAGSGRYVISPKRATKSRAWIKILAAFEAGETMEGIVTETTKGGLIVNLGLRAFLPESLIDVRKPADTKSFVGQTVTVKIIECEKLTGDRAAAERRSEKLVVNRKITMDGERKAAKQALMASLNVGDRKTGKVTALTDFGAFVDIGGVEGLIHISELAHRQVASASEVVKIGEQVEVIVVEVKTERGKIGLSRKRALANPWTQFAANHKAGDLVFGQVTGLAPFGVFVLVEGEGHDPVEGLVHISELSRFRVEDPSEVVNVGEGVWTQVLAIEPDKKRVSLSLRRALE